MARAMRRRTPETSSKRAARTRMRGVEETPVWVVMGGAGRVRRPTVGRADHPAARAASGWKIWPPLARETTAPANSFSARPRLSERAGRSWYVQPPSSVAANDYLRRILNARVYDVAVETPL